MALLVFGLENGKQADGLPDATMQTEARTKVFDFIYFTSRRMWWTETRQLVPPTLQKAQEPPLNQAMHSARLLAATLTPLTNEAQTALFNP